MNTHIIKLSWIFTLVSALFLTAATTAPFCAAADVGHAVAMTEQDRALLSSIVSALDADSRTSGQRISAQCNQGHVRLAGSVDSDAASKAAEHIVQQIPHVVAVENHLTVH